MVIARGYLFKPTILVAELCGAWAGIVYARRTLLVDHFIIKGKSAMVVT